MLGHRSGEFLFPDLFFSHLSVTIPAIKSHHCHNITHKKVITVTISTIKSHHCHNTNHKMPSLSQLIFPTTFVIYHQSKISIAPHAFTPAIIKHLATCLVISSGLPWMNCAIFTNTFFSSGSKYAPPNVAL